jgi:hypothetical protein
MTRRSHVTTETNEKPSNVVMPGISIDFWTFNEWKISKDLFIATSQISCAASENDNSLRRECPQLAMRNFGENNHCREREFVTYS